MSTTWPIPQSRVEAILMNVLGANYPILPPISRAEALLIAILDEFKNIAPKTTVAKTAADMTDTDRFYVYIGDETGYTYGDWYYYDPDDEEWKDGGVYQSTGVELDATLTESGVAADAAATGSRISTLASNVTETVTAAVTPVAVGAAEQYVDELTLPEEDDSTADHNIPKGWYFMVNNHLYRATRAIAAGTTISTLTNCTQVGLAEALNAWTDLDTTPTAGSLKAVTSDGIKTALDAKMDVMSIDDTPTNDSNNLVRSNGVYDADEFLRRKANDICDSLIDELRLRLTLNWTNGGINNQTGMLINDGSTSRCRDTMFFNGAKIYSVYNNSSSVLWIIFYTKNDNGTYTFSNSGYLNPGRNITLATTKWVRFDLRGPQSEGSLIRVFWRTKVVEDTNRLKNSIASTYSASETYAVGDYVLYDGGWNDGLYECNTEITTPEEWTAEHWTAVKVSDEIYDLKTSMGRVNTILPATPSEDGNYVLQCTVSDGAATYAWVAQS